MDQYLKSNAFKLSPNSYTLHESEESFIARDKTKIHFAYNKSKRTTYFEETAKRL